MKIPYTEQLRHLWCILIVPWLVFLCEDSVVMSVALMKCSKSESVDWIDTLCDRGVRACGERRGAESRPEGNPVMSVEAMMPSKSESVLMTEILWLWPESAKVADPD